MKFPKKCVVDTNVPVVSNLAKHPDPKSDINEDSILKCIEAIESVKNNNALVLDSDDIIFNQYRKNFDNNRYGNFGVGDYFYLWVRDNLYSFPAEDRVIVTKNGDTFNEFPKNEELKNFDPSDKIFIAVANKHKNKPPVLQGVDSKWWGYKDILESIGI